MSDREQSTPRTDSPTWQELAPFRETFLRHLMQPDDEKAVRHLGTLFFEMALDISRFWPKREEPEVVCDLKAAAADLRHLEQHLRANVVASLTASDLSAPEKLLARQAMGWADRLAEVAAEIEQGISG